MAGEPVIHLDADAFFASVEQASDPRLRGRPVAVGGEKRGIIASASYEARQCGIYTPMPTVRARRLCPKLVVLPGDFEKYERFSRWMFSYAYDFTPDVEVTSIDEGYFDLGKVRRDPVEVARTIRDAIRGALKITVSEGIGSNKLVSQVASKLYKPASFHAVPAGGEAAFLQPLPNKWLPGVGPKTSMRLDAAGLVRIEHVAATPVDMLELLVGSAAPALRRYAWGIDDRPVVVASEPAKSYSQQETFAQDQTDEGFIGATVRRMADELFAKVRSEGKAVRTLTVKVRYNDMAEDQRSESLAEPTDLETEVYGRLGVLLREAWKRRVSLRLVSLKLSNLYEGVFRMELALSREAQQSDARRRLARAVDVLREAKGRYVILRGHDFVLKEKEGERREERGEGGPTAEDRGQRTEDREPKTGDRRPGAEGAGQKSEVRGQRSEDGGLRAEDRRPKTEDRGLGAGDGGRVTLRAPHSALRIAKGVGVPLVVRSHYSFLDSTLSPEVAVGLAKEVGLGVVGMCDVGNLHGAVALVQAAKEAGVRPVLGAEVRVEGKPLRLFVENAQGYGNLCRLLSRGGGWKTEGAERRGQRSEVSSQQSEYGGPETGTGDRGEGEDERRTPNVERRTSNTEHRALDIDRWDTAGLVAVGVDAGLAEYFPGRFYLGVESAAAMRRVEGAGRWPCVAVVPVHYARPEDRWRLEIVQSIRTLTLLKEAHPGKLRGGERHFPVAGEWRELFGACPGLVERTWEIAERCAGFELPLGPPQFPAFRPPDGSSAREFLRRLVLEGAAMRYGAAHSAGHRAQIEEELRIIGEVGYEEYFLVVWDILQECRRRGIDWITRGSAADSLVCYCLGISGVCPVRFDLYFRRFLNKERMALHKLPDIDVDFPHDRKDDVIDLVFEKYGEEHCAVVGGFSTFQARSAFAEVAKVLGVAEREVRRFTEHFPWTFGGGWEGLDAGARSEVRKAVAGGGRERSEIRDQRAEGRGQKMEFIPHSALRTPHSEVGLVAMLRASPECRELPLDEEPYRSALVMAEALEGVPRYPKMHPCGVVLSRQPMRELTPTFVSGKGYATTHFDMDAVEAVGLVKMDILAQGGLAVMRDAVAMLRGRGVEVDLEQCGVRGEERGERREERGGGAPAYDDPEVWGMIASGQARAVHHIESPAMTSLCRMTNVREIDGLIAIVSVIRPGAANEQKKVRFTRRYQGLEAVEYPDASLERCLRGTYGLVVYEEHILQVCEAFAGLDPGRADVLRRALVKRKWMVVEEIGREFEAASRRRGHGEEKIREVWGLVTGFNGYAFCKAHSTAYGVEAYQSAWLKRYFPAEFMAAVLTNGKGFYRPLVYVLECHRLGIRLRVPCVNRSGPGFGVERGRECGGRSAECGVRGSESGVRSPEIGGRSLQNGDGDVFIRVPVGRIKGVGGRMLERLSRERMRGEFRSLTDFYRRVVPLPEEMEALIRCGALDVFGQTRTEQFWEAQVLHRRFGRESSGQGWLLESGECGVRSGEWGERREKRGERREEVGGRSPESGVRSPGGRGQRTLDSEGRGMGAEQVTPASAFRGPHREEPSRGQRLLWEMELLGFVASGHPLELYGDVAWETYCPVSRLGEHVGSEVVVCGLVVEDRVHHQVTGEPMKFLTICDWTGMVETELFAATYRSYGLATVRYPVLEVEGRVEAFESGRGYTLRVLRAGKPRTVRGRGGNRIGG